MPLRGGGYRPNVLIGRDLVKQFGQHGRAADIAGGDLDGPYFQDVSANSQPRPFLILLTLFDTYMYLAPNPALRAATLAGVPFSVALGLE